MIFIGLPVLFRSGRCSCYHHLNSMSKALLHGRTVKGQDSIYAVNVVAKIARARSVEGVMMRGVGAVRMITKIAYPALMVRTYVKM